MGVVDDYWLGVFGVVYDGIVVVGGDFVVVK